MSFYTLGTKKSILVSTLNNDIAVSNNNIPQLVYVDRPIEVIKEVIVEKPIVTIQEQITYVDRPVPVEVLKEVTVEKQIFVDRPIEVIKEVEKVIEIIKEVKVDVVREVKSVPKWSIVLLIVETAVIITLILTK